VAVAPAGVDAALADLAEAGLASGDPGGTTWVVAGRLVREVTVSSMLQATREAAEARLREVAADEPEASTAEGA